MASIDPRPTIAQPDDDPWIWLEKVDGTQALAFVEQQNSRTLAKFGNNAFAHDRDILAAIFDRSDNIPFVTRRGPLLYNFWKDRDNPRGLWRTTTLASYASKHPNWTIILDIDALAKEEDEDWIWKGAATLPGSHERAILSLSKGGGDAVVLREFDLVSKSFVMDGFMLPEAKSNVSWLDADTLILSSAHGEDKATKAGYARTVRLWRRGHDIEQAETIFETAPENMGVWSLRDRTQASQTIWIKENLGFFDSNVWHRDQTGTNIKLDLPTDCSVDVHEDWLAVQRRSSWEINGETHKPGTVLGIGLSDFLDGSRDFEILFAPAKRQALQHFFWCNSQLILSILDNLQPVFDVHTPSKQGWTRSSLQGLPKIGVVNVMPLDNEEAEATGELLAITQDPVTPSSLLMLDPPKSPTLLKQAPHVFDSDGITVTQYEARSSDGEKIPYVQIGPANSDGNAPVHMNGYGGFQLSRPATYNSAIGKLWLERGGTSVIANIRGGGEFGPQWHQAGRREGKILSHDDFAAIAADLVTRGVTTPKRIAAEGGSNGGILITNMLTRYPDHFGALFCTIPLIDMRRYHKLLAGASWIAEYGDPEDPNDWKFLQKYSAYHTAKPDQPYPPILLATTTKDDRVHPGHARKMTAKLQAMHYDAYLFETASGGHGYGKDNKERATFTALGYAFLRENIGWVEREEA